MDTPAILRRGWTTGACATAAAKAAWSSLCGHGFPDPVAITLPGGRTASFALAETASGPGWASAGVVKDAGDDPDVTHGALVRAVLRPCAGGGIVFRAGPGVGTVTRPGLPLPPGEPAINPVPRRMITAALAEVSGDAAVHVEVELSVPGGERLAERTLNGRLGIVGGLSILGTTGVVVPYSCAAWIDTIHRGVDVARATGTGHIAGSTGSTSERAVQLLHALPEVALIEMGDFVGGLLKYVRARPVPRLTLAGGVAKMTKLAQGRLDLHSRRGAVDMAALAELAPEVALADSNTAAEAFACAASAGVDLGNRVAGRAWAVASAALDDAPVELDVVLFNRDGALVGHHPPPLNRRT